MPFEEKCNALRCFVTGPVAYKAPESFERLSRKLPQHALSPVSCLRIWCLPRQLRRALQQTMFQCCLQCPNAGKWTCFGVTETFDDHRFKA